MPGCGDGLSSNRTRFAALQRCANWPCSASRNAVPGVDAGPTARADLALPSRSGAASGPARGSDLCGKRTGARGPVPLASALGTASLRGARAHSMLAAEAEFRRGVAAGADVRGPPFTSMATVTLRSMGSPNKRAAGCCRRPGIGRKRPGGAAEEGEMRIPVRGSQAGARLRPRRRTSAGSRRGFRAAEMKTAGAHWPTVVFPNHKPRGAVKKVLRSCSFERAAS